MATDASDFRRQLGQVLVRTSRRSHRVVQAIALEGLRRIVFRTPVDTGRARASWQLTADRPAASSPIGVDPSGAATIGKAAGTVETIPPGHDVYVVSNLVYMVALERGHSSQAPNGMVAVTIEELKLLSDRLISRAAQGQL